MYEQKDRSADEKLHFNIIWRNVNPNDNELTAVCFAHPSILVFQFSSAIAQVLAKLSPNHWFDQIL